MAITRLGPNQSINLASNVTGTLPAANVATLTSSNLPSGSVLQVVKASTNNSSHAITSTSFAGVANVLSITPSNSSNKIFFTGTYNSTSDVTDGGGLVVAVYFQINGGGYSIVPELNSSGYITYDNVSGTYIHANNCVSFLHSPSTTQQVDYRFYVRSYDTGQCFFAGDWGGITMVAKEIKG